MYAHELYEQSKPQVIVTYPGRFQPFHQGHAEVFSQLQKKFGRDSVYILTSNDTSSAKSPFSFSDKYQLMTAAGIPGDRIIETNQMYKLPANVDAANTIFITAVGAPDADRLNPDTFTKRDQKDKDGNVTKPAGSPSYYKIWNDKAQPVTADQHGYVIVIPEIHKEITIKGRKYDVSHGTECRNLWNTFRNDPKARKEFLSQMYKNPGQELAAIFDKIPQATAEDISTDSQTSTSPIHGGQPTQGVTEGSLNEFAPDNGGGDGRWYTDDEIADIIGEDWLEFDLSGEAANISIHGEHAKILLVQEAQAYFEDRGYHGVTVQDVRDDEDYLSWYISGNFTRLSEGATEGNNQSSVKTGIYQTDVLGAKAYHSKCLEKSCDWESRRYDRIKQAQDAAKKHAQTHIKPGMAEDAAGVGVVAKNKKMARDPRYSMSITKDVKPSTPKNMLRAFRLSENSDVSPETVMGIVKKFLPLAMKELKLFTLPKIILKKHLVAHDGQATFGRFVNEEQKIYLGIADRHPVDILRTLAHELVHYKQHTQGKLGPDSGETGSPIENQANAVAAVIMRHFNKKYPDAIHSNAISIEESLNKKYKTFLENDEPDEVRQKKNLIPFPKGTVKVDVSDVYDWYKIGQTISDLDDADPKDFGKGPPQTVLSFGSEPQEHKYLKDLKRLGLKTHDIDETYNGPKMKFLRPGELRGSYTDKQLRDMGFKRSEQGAWYIPYEQWKQLVASKAISENPDIVNEKKKRKKRKTNLKGRPFYGYYYGLGTAADSGAGSGDGGGGGIAEGKMAELDMDLDDPEISDREFEKIYGMTRSEARELFSRTNVWDFPDFRDPDKPLHEQGVAEGLDDIEDTRQFRNAIALAKSQKAIRQAKDGKDAKYYADGTKVTPAEVARRAAERKAKKQGVAEGSQRTQFTDEELDAINQYLDDDLSFQELRTYPGLIRKIASHFGITSIQGHSGEMNFYDRLVQARAEGDIPEQGVAEGLSEAREGAMREIIRKELPSWPDYVIKDWISSRIKNEEDLKNLQGWLGELNKMVRPNSWQLHQKMFLTFDMLNPRSRYFMKTKRKFGDRNPFLIPRDKERLEDAIKLVQAKGIENLPPISMLQHDNGLELCEGWHRTMAAFRLHPEGFYINAWIGQAGQQGVAEGYSNTTFNVDRRKLNVPALIQKGAIFVTYPHGEQGWETDNKEDWAFSLLSLYNVLRGGWTSEAKKYLKPESYRRAEQEINSSAPNLGSDKLVYDGKYNQILWSIKKLGIPENVAFLDKGQQGVAEAFDQPYKLKWEKSEHGDYDALATLDDGTYLSIMFNLGDLIEDHWMVEFYRNNSQEVTGEGDAQRVFATVLTAIQQFIKKKKPESLFFSAVKENDPTGSRTRLYDRLVQRYANGLGYNLQKEDYPEQTGYRLTKVKRGVAENFADGKNPGRKGLAKRMGVPTKASVSKLRKIAKSSSGEKQRMAHWMANMKAGKAKK